MRKQRFLHLVILMLFSCVQPDQEDYIPVQPQQPTLTILINDLSQSADFIEFTLAEWRKVWGSDATNGGCQLALIQVTDNSLKQTPILTNLVKLDTLVPTGTIYQKNSTKKENRRKTVTTQEIFDTWEHQLGKLLSIPQTGSQTDLNGALTLAEQTALPFASREYHIRLLIRSDMIHDLENDSKLKSFEFPAETEVIIIGVGDQPLYSRVFLNTNITCLPVFKAELLPNS